MCEVTVREEIRLDLAITVISITGLKLSGGTTASFEAVIDTRKVIDVKPSVSILTGSQFAIESTSGVAQNEND
jgi:hypothetical protein